MLTHHARFIVGCLVASAVLFPLGLLWWGGRRRHRVGLLLTVALVGLTGAVGALFFLGLRAIIGFPVEWYQPLGMANVLAVIFLGFRGVEAPTMSWAPRVAYYALVGAMLVALLGLPAVLWLAAGGPTPYFWGLLASQLLWDALFWRIAVSYPPMEEAREAP
jgi:hypothetical protein